MRKHYYLDITGLNNPLSLNRNLNLSQSKIRLRVVSRLRLGIETGFAFIFFLLLFAGTASAQNLEAELTSFQTLVRDSSNISSNQAGSDSINISQIVQQQIDAARKKQLEEQQKASLNVVLKARENKAGGVEYFFANLRKSIPLSDDLLMKFSILGSAAFLASLFIFMRRFRGRKKSAKTDLKRNIKLLREEKIFSKKDKKLSGLRTKLSGAPSTYELSNRAVARNARDMNIAKGEIYLAARIKSHEMKKAGGRKN